MRVVHMFSIMALGFGTTVRLMFFNISDVERVRKRYTMTVSAEQATHNSDIQKYIDYFCETQCALYMCLFSNEVLYSIGTKLLRYMIQQYIHLVPFKLNRIITYVRTHSRTYMYMPYYTASSP